MSRTVRYNDPDIWVIESVEQGPPGPTGPSAEEEEMNYARRKDMDVSDTTLTIWKGWAVPGHEDESQGWRIMRSVMTLATLETVVQWADGNTDMDNSWTNRKTTVVYS